MKILLLCNKPPWPPLEGGPIAMNAMVKGLLHAGHQVKVLSVNTNKYNVKPEDIPKDYKKSTGIELIYIDLTVRLLPALFSFLKNESHHISRFNSDAFRLALEKLLAKEKFDIIQFETLYVTPYISLIREFSDARLVLRAHNIEHLIWKRIAQNCNNPLKRLYLRQLASSLEKYEKSVLTRIDGVVAITGKDAEYFRIVRPELPVTDIPFGIDAEVEGSLKNKSAPGNRGFFHLGSMNWMPNEEGIRWFLLKVWPGIYSKNPELTFSLAGRAMPLWIKKLKMPGIIVDGEVPDACEYMENHGAMIVPLFSGSGIRIKIIEGMLAGKAIITTPIGAEGINYTAGKNLLIARNESEFAEAVEFIASHDEEATKIGRAARELVLKEHNNTLLMAKLGDFYNTLR
ncbi:MAG: glycosyltransferase family 4 protein [Lentimicrobium sp.]|nr:glycosyltransferase family 4 protein [Lentimicrobium sp.]